jgi:ABC-type nickel/cobalt efflux system permease component RcnA
MKGVARNPAKGYMAHSLEVSNRCLVKCGREHTFDGGVTGHGRNSENSVWIMGGQEPCPLALIMLEFKHPADSTIKERQVYLHWNAR